MATITAAGFIHTARFADDSSKTLKVQPAGRALDFQIRHHKSGEAAPRIIRLTHDEAAELHSWIGRHLELHAEKE